MKKIIILISSFLFFMTSIFAEENLLTMRAGGYFEFMTSVGIMRDYVQDNIGGGITYDLGFKLSETNLEIGATVHGTFSGGLSKNEAIDSFWSNSWTAGFFVLVPFGSSGFSFMPELNYGVLLNFPKCSSDFINAENIKSVYADQTLQLVLTFKYAPAAILDGKLEFDVSPVYQLNPEKNQTIHMIGFRTGILYRFM